MNPKTFAATAAAACAQPGAMRAGVEHFRDFERDAQDLIDEAPQTVLPALTAFSTGPTPSAPASK